MLILDHMV